jgi:CRISPR-associated protein Cmr3
MTQPADPSSTPGNGSAGNGSLCLALVPRDGLFCKDGRGWYTSDVGRSHAWPWPLPPTVRGALRAACGHAIMRQSGERLAPKDWERRTERVAVRALLGLRRPPDQEAFQEAFSAAHRVWPVSQDAFHGDNGLVRRLEPVPGPGLPGLDLHDLHAGGDFGPADGDAFQALWRPRLDPDRKPGPRPDFWCEERMIDWLAGRAIASAAADCAPARRREVHVTIDADTGAATPSMLFSSQVTEPLDADGHTWALAVRCRLPEDVAWADMRGQPLGLGGRRRLTWMEAADDALFAMPVGLRAALAGSPGLRLVCVTPARFTRGWLPDGFAAEGGHYVGTLPGVSVAVRLRAALVPRPLDLSTWDTVANRPRATRRLVAPGAVYFFDKADGSAFTAEEHARLWLARLGDDNDDGLGLVVPGRWEPGSTPRGNT